VGKFILVLVLLMALGGGLRAAPWDLPDVLHDPRTKSTYRLESDRLHIDAFSADGKLIWRTKVTRGYPIGLGSERTQIVSWGFWQHVRPKRNEYVLLTGDGYLQVSFCVFNYGFVGGSIDKRTGEFCVLIVS